ncbi:hypothetical protein [Vibrio sp. 1F255]|uniref:hypothetical protein n=1 Tax=Vibrio sp. 1F255 TaxID=3230009 RepID=UPI00352CC819
MSETAGTIIKLMSALTSPKAAVKYITIGVFIVLSWKYLNENLTELGAPPEHLSLIVLLIGLGVGSLFGQLICYLTSKSWGKVTSYFNEKSETKKKLIEDNKTKELEKEKNAEFLLKFKKAFEHYDYWTRSTLRELTEGEQCLEWGYAHIDNLKDNSYILKVTNVDSEKDIYEIHPVIKQFVKEHWEAEINSTLKDFFRNTSQYKAQLLELMTHDTDVASKDIETKTIELLNEFPRCFSKEAEDETGFYICFKDSYLTHFEKETGKTFIDEVYITHEQILRSALKD